MCYLLIREVGHTEHQAVEKFVSKPFTKWKDGTEEMVKHSVAEYHKNAFLKAEMHTKINNQDSALLINQS